MTFSEDGAACLEILFKKKIKAEGHPLYPFNLPADLVKLPLISGSSPPLLCPHFSLPSSLKAIEPERKSGHSGMQLITARTIQFLVRARVEVTVWWPAEMGRVVSCAC